MYICADIYIYIYCIYISSSLIMSSGHPSNTNVIFRKVFSLHVNDDRERGNETNGGGFTGWFNFL